MESRNITLVGIWAFAIISLLGGLAGELDGLVVIIFFIVALVVSVGMVAMPVSKAQKSASE